MKMLSISLFLLALFIRMVVVNLWQVPKLIYIPIELTILVFALYFERARIRDFFLIRENIRSDLALGFVLGLIYCFLEWLQLGITEGKYLVLRWDTLAVVPLGIVVAGWRAGVYEELLFRSLAMGYLHRLTKSGVIAMIGQGVLFWAAHTRYLNPESQWGISTGVFGLLLGWIAFKRKSVIPGMVIHSMANSYGGATLAPYDYLMKALSSWLPSH